MYKHDKEILKLSRLCDHWATHNDSHIESFEKWRSIAEEKALTSIVDNLNNAINMMKNCNNYLLAAKRELEKLL